ncbi:MAG TPA: MurR/RpiR family transcriptional regulator [Candidatus Fimiplasma intestinipullorum]|uniref:MurR/RpiR family transcriptional regulator n=1 Tax=Candidatus Fimiplasma intestinipullorum TaxID=2840825 RepID=A0A9D1KZL9_9FIRM|nr:MurR/RpiR family transcriptional regulator [Candidatus Fimiplasma intestinipullorum]
MNILSRLEQYPHFTDVEKEFASYVLEHPHEILDLSVDALAKKSFVSVSTVYRVINKLGLNGLNELKLRINADYESYLSEKKSVDYNYPFHKQNTPHQIMTKMIALYDQTLQSTLNLVDLDSLSKAVSLLEKSQRILIFPSIGNFFIAEGFRQNMMEIGVAVEIVKEKFYQHWISQSCTDRDLVMLITYACRTAYFVDLVQTLKAKGTKILLISSTFENRISSQADLHLYFASYEDSEEKIASFSSRLSLHYLLDCLYACYFNRNYEKNLDMKIDHYIDY